MSEDAAGVRLTKLGYAAASRSAIGLSRGQWPYPVIQATPRWDSRYPDRDTLRRDEP